jgi:hypothetical protein
MFLNTNSLCLNVNNSGMLMGMSHSTPYLKGDMPSHLPESIASLSHQETEGVSAPDLAPLSANGGFGGARGSGMDGGSFALPHGGALSGMLANGGFGNGRGSGIRRHHRKAANHIHFPL